MKIPFGHHLMMIALTIIICLFMGLWSALDYLNYSKVENVLQEAGYDELVIETTDGSACATGYSRGFRGIDKNGLVQSGYVCIFAENKSLIGLISESKL